MTVLEKSKLFSSPKLDSRIKSANVQKSERWLGFFASPAIIYIAYYVMSGTYLNQFYVDVVKAGGIAGGAFLALLPVLSKVLDAVTNLLMGMVIDRTKTRQGKARPWLLISAPILAIAGIALYVVPSGNSTLQVIWIAISYNLYFAFAFTAYNMSQALLVPLSTRNTKQRDSLALFLSMGQTMIPGSLVYIIVPLLFLPWMGVDASRWALVMSIISILTLPGILIQYYFTKERVSEDAASSEAQKVDLWTQIKTCFSDKYWLYFFAMWFFYQFAANIYSVSVNFYANWVLGTYNDGSTLTLINAVGQAPLGLGVFLLWPIAKKFGKRWTTHAGMLIAATGCLLVFFNARSMGPVLGALALRSFGLLPSYLFVSMMADAMDHIEWKNGYRCDGFTATMNSIMVTIMAGLCTTVFNTGLRIGAANGYVPPAADGSWVAQSTQMQNWFCICVALLPAIMYVIVAVFAYFFDVEKQIPTMSKEISDRHRKEAEAQGLVYVSPEEKARLEQEENDRIAEETRIKELRERCAKKGLNYDEEEAKYQAQLAAKKAKEEAKAAKKNKN